MTAPEIGDEAAALRDSVARFFGVRREDPSVALLLVQAEKHPKGLQSVAELVRWATDNPGHVNAPEPWLAKAWKANAAKLVDRQLDADQKARARAPEGATNPAYEIKTGIHAKVLADLEEADNAKPEERQPPSPHENDSQERPPLADVVGSIVQRSRRGRPETTADAAATCTEQRRTP